MKREGEKESGSRHMIPLMHVLYSLESVFKLRLVKTELYSIFFIFFCHFQLIVILFAALPCAPLWPHRCWGFCLCCYFACALAHIYLNCCFLLLLFCFSNDFRVRRAFHSQFSHFSFRSSARENFFIRFSFYIAPFFCCSSFLYFILFFCYLLGLRTIKPVKCFGSNVKRSGSFLSCFLLPRDDVYPF